MGGHLEVAVAAALRRVGGVGLQRPGVAHVSRPEDILGVGRLVGRDAALEHAVVPVLKRGDFRVDRLGERDQLHRGQHAARALARRVIKAGFVVDRPGDAIVALCQRGDNTPALTHVGHLRIGIAGVALGEQLALAAAGRLELQPRDVVSGRLPRALALREPRQRVRAALGHPARGRALGAQRMMGVVLDGVQAGALEANRAVGGERARRLVAHRRAGLVLEGEVDAYGTLHLHGRRAAREAPVLLARGHAHQDLGAGGLGPAPLGVPHPRLAAIVAVLEVGVRDVALRRDDRLAIAEDEGRFDRRRLGARRHILGHDGLGGRHISFQTTVKLGSHQITEH